MDNIELVKRIGERSKKPVNAFKKLAKLYPTIFKDKLALEKMLEYLLPFGYRIDKLVAKKATYSMASHSACSDSNEDDRGYDTGHPACGRSNGDDDGYGHPACGRSSRRSSGRSHSACGYSCASTKSSKAYIKTFNPIIPIEN
jgi:hypothetical protein